MLVINAGSSSVKFGIYTESACVFKKTLSECPSIHQAIQQIPVMINTSSGAAFTIDAVAHRVVHGGQHTVPACVITNDVITQIESNIALAPLYNPANLEGIRVAQTCWPSLPQIAVFDTSFHQTLPDYAQAYAVPKRWRDWGVRRYGFHGTSHQYVMEQVAQYLGLPATALQIISCHLGNGASVCAIERGKSVDTSMGMSTLEGLVMGTRSGDVDPGLFNFLIREKNSSLR